MSAESKSKQITCCQCKMDMTDAVRRACKERSSGGVIPLYMQPKGVPASVQLQCPNGHWCEYGCTSATIEGE